MASSKRSLVRSALQLQRALLTSGRAHYHQQQTRSFRQSAVALARRNRRTGASATASAAAPETTAVFGGSGSSERDDEDDEREVREWFEQMQLQQQQLRGKRGASEKRDFGALAEPDDDDIEDSDDDEDDENAEEDDEETEEFLSEVDELFALEPEEFERKMQSFDKRQANVARHRRVRSDEDEDDGSYTQDVDEEEEDDDDEEEIERATERISKKKLLKVLDAFQPGTSSRNEDSITSPKTKNAAPLEKKAKKVNVDRVSYRQERVELSVVDFVQNLIMQDSDTHATDVIANIVEASVAPDLRRVVLYWEAQRLNSENQTISKRKVAGIERRLQTQERWIRAQVTRHLNLKYSPNVQFKQRRTAKSDEALAKFDREMMWLDRF